MTGPTRSQSLFSVYTGLDACALAVNGSDEFYLFMDLRAEQQWVSYSMNSWKWLAATNEFNSRLEALNASKNAVHIPKHPRAPMEQLGKVETKVATWIACNDFKSTAGTETFRRRHCFVVSLVKLTGGSHSHGADAKSRKTAICSRCHTVMYPGGSQNHKKGYCVDGARQVKGKGEDEIPDWPQLQGIYMKGTDFRPVEFLKTLRDMYERVVVRGERHTDLPVEYEAFGKVLQRRTTVNEDGSVLFKLYDLIMPTSTPDGLVVLHNGHQHLRLDCLRDD
ncbi:hypothetical protein BC827DRAFT_1235658 [Russula dissimulans]|nr:hypothetical protein BC827DRAFT_1235658 [Russula dissimulans]